MGMYAITFGFVVILVGFFYEAVVVMTKPQAKVIEIRSYDNKGELKAVEIHTFEESD